MKEIKAIVRAERVDDIIHALHEIQKLPGITVSVVRGVGRRTSPRPQGPRFGEVSMAKLETVVPDELVERVIATIREVGHTGRAGDGKIFVTDVRRAINIRDDAEGIGIL